MKGEREVRNPLFWLLRGKTIVFALEREAHCFHSWGSHKWREQFQREGGSCFEGRHWVREEKRGWWKGYPLLGYGRGKNQRGGKQIQSSWEWGTRFWRDCCRVSGREEEQRRGIAACWKPINIAQGELLRYDHLTDIWILFWWLNVLILSPILFVWSLFHLCVLHIVIPLFMF